MSAISKLTINPNYSAIFWEQITPNIFEILQSSWLTEWQHMMTVSISSWPFINKWLTKKRRITKRYNKLTLPHLPVEPFTHKTPHRHADNVSLLNQTIIVHEPTMWCFVSLQQHNLPWITRWWCHSLFYILHQNYTWTTHEWSVRACH